MHLPGISVPVRRAPRGTAAEAHGPEHAPEHPAEPVHALTAPSRNSSLGYRPALDGIRAIAVLAVIAYHFGYRQVQGGFLGVDVFFVLSGYLITSLLLAEHARTGAIDLVAFWYRRAKRLLPALLLLLVAVAVWIGLTAAPFEMSIRREDLFWTLFYGANWHFIASGQDYFVQYASASPLRHTWSLAIEEQFYLAWPLLVAAALWVGRRRPAVVAALCVAGIALSTLAMALLYDASDPSRAYYGTDARAHELLVGALLAVLIRESARRLREPASGGLRSLRLSPRLAPAATVAAAVVLLAAFAFLSDKDPLYYRGLALVLSLTAALLVWGVEAAPRSIPARVISLRPLAWIGQISYGLYLWHWLIVVAVTSPTGPFKSLPGSVGLNAERLALTFAAATASFYLLEQPIRRGIVPFIGPSIRRFAVAIAVAVIAVGGVSWWQTYAPPGSELVSQKDTSCTDFQICARHTGSAGAPVVAVLGDSIARSLDPGFLAAAETHDFTYVLAATDGCRVSHLLTLTDGQPSKKAQQCFDRMPTVESELLSTWHPTVIVVYDRWEIMDLRAPDDGHTVARSTDESQRYEAAALADLSRQLTASGAKLAYIELVPVIGADCAKPDNFSSPNCNRPVASYTVHDPYNAIFRDLASKIANVSTISITDAVCPNGVCVATIDGVVMRTDGNHFTEAAARWLAPVLYKDLQTVVALR